jgi:subtilisin family serine protease
MGTESESNGAEDVEGRLLRTQTYAAIVVVVLVIATIAVALTLERPDGEVTRSTWAFEMVQLEKANELGWTGQGVRVGILDTGIDMDHPCMAGVKVVAWQDPLGGGPEPYDDHGHGTAMASLIAGRSPLRGGAPDVELIVVKVIDGDEPTPGNFDFLVAEGIDFCVANGADIISLSLGGEYDDIDLIVGSATEAAINQAVASGVLLVAAAGNDAGDDVLHPSRFRDVISVGAVDRRGQMAPFSNSGDDSVARPDPDKKPEVVAPGVDIVTAHVDGAYARGSGTSHATAIVSAVLAVVASHVRDILDEGSRGGNETAVRTVKMALMNSTTEVNGQTLPHDPKAGYGLVQAVDLATKLEA